MHLVLLPGLYGTGDLFAPFTAALPAGVDHTVVRYPGDVPLGANQLQQVIQRSIPRDGPYALVAESFSGPLAIEHAARASGRLHALVLCASYASNPLPTALRWLRWFAYPWLFRLAAPVFALRRLVRVGSLAGLLEMHGAAIRDVRPEVWASRVRLALDGDVTERLPRLEVPVLYLAARRDRVVGRRNLARIRNKLPDLETVTLDGPHWLLQALPRECVSAIMEFLERTEQAPSTPPSS